VEKFLTETGLYPVKVPKFTLIFVRVDMALPIINGLSQHRKNDPLMVEDEHHFPGAELIPYAECRGQFQASQTIIALSSISTTPKNI